MTFPLIKSRSHLGLVRFPSSHEPWQGGRRRWKQSPLWLLQSSSSKGKLILHRNLFCAVTCQPTISHRHPNKNPTEKNLLPISWWFTLGLLANSIYYYFGISTLLYPVFASKSRYRLQSKVWISRPRAKLHEQSGTRLTEEQRRLAEEKVLWQVSMGEAAVR